MPSQYPDGSDPNVWFGDNNGGGGGDDGVSSTTIVWIVAGILIAILVLVIVYYIAKKGKSFGLCCSCKIEFGHSHHGPSKC
ncbi:Uncharacterized protein TCM_002546 [Theobroma cacao]|uniref:Uncharacterized protein n=1 Tax=Theobroma cacao TaxID=3641 RepID=A0A061DLM5_THECC|nr:Uncharacterized protein TCM_002546 [Theobroma cacao]